MRKQSPRRQSQRPPPPPPPPLLVPDKGSEHATTSPRRVSTTPTTTNTTTHRPPTRPPLKPTGISPVEEEEKKKKKKGVLPRRGRSSDPRPSRPTKQIQMTGHQTHGTDTDPLESTPFPNHTRTKRKTILLSRILNTTTTTDGKQRRNSATGVDPADTNEDALLDMEQGKLSIECSPQTKSATHATGTLRRRFDWILVAGAVCFFLVVVITAIMLLGKQHK